MCLCAFMIVNHDSVATGEDADKSFLRKLSLKNVGFSRHIYEASDAALQLHDFYRQISSPLVANVKFVYPPDQVFLFIFIFCRIL